MIRSEHDNNRCSFTARRSARDSSAEDGASRPERDDVSRGGQGVRYRTSYGLPLGVGVPPGRGEGPEGPTPGTAPGDALGPAPSRPNRPTHRGPLPRSTPAPLRPVDPGSRPATHRHEVPAPALGLDGGTVPEAVGPHAAKTSAPSLRTASRSRSPVAHRGAPR